MLKIEEERAIQDAVKAQLGIDAVNDDVDISSCISAVTDRIIAEGYCVGVPLGIRTVGDLRKQIHIHPL